MFTSRYLKAEKVREVGELSTVTGAKNFLLGNSVKAVFSDAKGRE